MEQQYTPKQPEQNYQKRYGGISLAITNPENMELRLQEPGARLLLHHSDFSDDLPTPFTETSIDYEHDEYTDIFRFSGHISFNMQPSTLEWRADAEDILKYIADTLEHNTGERVIHLPNHSRTFYVKLDDTYATGVSFIEEVGQASILFKQERLIEVLAGLDANHDYDPPVEPETPRIELMKRFVDHWHVSLASIQDLLGNVNKPHHISINLPAGEEPTAGESPSVQETEQDHTTFDDVGGAFEAKRRIKRVIDVFNRPDLAATYGITPTSFILHGPAGTGKTTLAHAFASSINAELREFSSTDIVDSYVGNSGKNIAAIFDNARLTTHPLVLFFDEFDSIAPKGNAGTTERRDVKNVLKQQLTAIASHPNIVVIAATNEDPHGFDEALLRAGRLAPIYVGIPNDEERIDIWGLVLFRSMNHLNGNAQLFNLAEEGPSEQPAVYGQDIDIVELNTATDGLTGADIEQILLRAREDALEKTIATGTFTTIQQEDIMRSIRNYQKP